MSTIVAALDASSVAPTVLAVAAAVADRLGASVTALHARTARDVPVPASVVAATDAAGVALDVVDGPPARAIVALAPEDVVAVVVGTRGHRHGKLPAGSTAMAVVTSARVPVVVTPPGVHLRGIDRVLVPLEGTEGPDAPAPVLPALVGGGAHLVALHVFVPATVPSFWDQPHHAAPAWSSGFLARFGPAETEDLWLRCGDIGEAVLDVVDQAGIDLIALTWTQDASGTHAPVVRALLARSPVPLLLLPRPAPGATGSDGP